MEKTQRHHYFLLLFFSAIIMAATSSPLVTGFTAPRSSSSFRVLRTIRITTTTIMMFSKQRPGVPPRPDGEENLQALFERAVVLQRSGFQEEALENYQRFVKASKQCSANPTQYAQVLENMEAIETKQQYDEDDEVEAVKHYSVGAAHVHLALIILRDGKQSSDPKVGFQALEVAKLHCQDAIELNDEKQSVVDATKLLGDIDKMLRQMNHGLDSWM